MKAFYISSHGFGHLTRSLVHIRSILDKNQENLYIASGERQVDFAKQVLNKYNARLVFNVIETDIGLITFNESLTVDKVFLEKSLHSFISSWDSLVSNEIGLLKKYSVSEVFTDISPIGMLVGNKLGVKVTAISNFTWYNQYKFLNLDDEIVKVFYSCDQLINEFWVYPLALDLSHIYCRKIGIDYVARDFDFEKINSLKSKSENILFISCGKSAFLKVINISNFSGTIYYTEGIEICGEGEHIKLPVSTPDTHNYIAASNFVISKAGWGTIAESVLAKVPMLLIEREDVLEDSHNINELKKQGKASSIAIENMKYLDIEMIYTNKIKPLLKNFN